MFGKIGRNTPASTGTNPLRADHLGGLVVAGSNYQDKTQGGKHYFAFCQSQNVTVYSATSAVGLQVYNPPTSGVNLIFYKWSVNVWAASIGLTGMVLGVGTQLTLPTTTTAATLTGKTLLTASTGLTTGSAAAYSIATILAPAYAWPLFHNTVTIATKGAEIMGGDLKGAFGAAPGTCVVMGALGATGVTVDMGITWEEVPVGL